MSTVVAEACAAHAGGTAHHSALRRAQAALYLGAAAAVALAAIELFVKTTSTNGNFGAFRHAGDYALNGDGIPYVVALLVLLPSLRTLQQRRDGRLGLTGIALASLGAVVLGGMFVYCLAAATDDSLGPTYVLASLGTIVGVALFAAGSWHAGLLPRWLLPLGHSPGSSAACSPSPARRRCCSPPST